MSSCSLDLVLQRTFLGGAALVSTTHFQTKTFQFFPMPCFFSNGWRQTVFKLSCRAFTLCCKQQRIGSGGSPVPSSTLFSAAASAVTTSCWGSPFWGEACWPPQMQHMLLSSSARGGGRDPQAPCWSQPESTDYGLMYAYRMTKTVYISRWVPEHSNSIFYCPGLHCTFIRNNSVNILLQRNFQVALFYGKKFDSNKMKAVWYWSLFFLTMSVSIGCICSPTQFSPILSPVSCQYLSLAYLLD